MTKGISSGTDDIGDLGCGLFDRRNRNESRKSEHEQSRVHFHLLQIAERSRKALPIPRMPCGLIVTGTDFRASVSLIFQELMRC
jgi:hypothetical protein